ncbi:MAG: hypothetical protein Q7U82_11975 [Gammaproteobacteria bacterium]|nr:hypothetical protein [Gammaproteobacteria bacterium]
MSDNTAAPKESSERREWRNLALWLFFMLIIFGFGFLDDSKRGVNIVSLLIPSVISFALGAAWLVRATFEWFRADPKPLSSLELKEFRSKLHDSAIARYSIAVVLICCAFFITDAKENLWWLAIFLLLWAAILAREVTYLLILGGGAFLIFDGLASISVSAAIIIGALIIASAVRR